MFLVDAIVKFAFHGLEVKIQHLQALFFFSNEFNNKKECSGAEEGTQRITVLAAPPEHPDSIPSTTLWFTVIYIKFQGSNAYAGTRQAHSVHIHTHIHTHACKILIHIKLK